MTTAGTEFDRTQEMAHDAGPEESWQESIVLTWFDVDNEIGGYHRIGHEVPAGLANTWSGLISADGLRYRRLVADHALTEPDRATDRFGAGSQALLLGADDLRFVLADDECSLELAIEDFYVPRALWGQASADVASGTIKNHYEGSGRVTGELRWDGRTIAIDGFFHRDHSWGPRDWGMVASHRWFAGTVGPGLSWSVGVMRGWDGRGMAAAGIVRDGVLHEATDVDVVRYQEMDGVSHRGGHARITLADGEVLEITGEAFDGILNRHHDYFGIDAPCRMTTGDGRVGSGIVEASDGLRYEVRSATKAILEDGLTRRSPRARAVDHRVDRA